MIVKYLAVIFFLSRALPPGENVVVGVETVELIPVGSGDLFCISLGETPRLSFKIVWRTHGTERGIGSRPQWAIGLGQ